jgi:hypothetical protein
MVDARPPIYHSERVDSPDILSHGGGRRGSSKKKVRIAESESPDRRSSHKSRPSESKEERAIRKAEARERKEQREFER